MMSPKQSFNKGIKIQKYPDFEAKRSFIQYMSKFCKNGPPVQKMREQ